MSKEAVFSLKLEAGLRDAFMKEAAESNRPASQIVRDFMREFVRAQAARREYERCLDSDLDQAVAAADDPNTKWYSQEDMREHMDVQRESLLTRMNGRDAADGAFIR